MFPYKRTIFGEHKMSVLKSAIIYKNPQLLLTST